MHESWKLEFLRLLLSGSPADTEAAFQLKALGAPPTLFKFQPPTDRAFDALRAGATWFASPTTFNDPFDSAIMFDLRRLTREFAKTLLGEGDLAHLASLGISHDDFAAHVAGEGDPTTIPRIVAAAPESERESLHKALLALPSLIQQQVHEWASNPQVQSALQTRYRVTCFAERATSMVLWGHYAAAHQGFCVEYATETLTSEAFGTMLFPVIYEAQRFDFSAALRTAPSGHGPLPIHAIAACLHKAPDWSYEREWRLILILHPTPPGSGVPVQMPKPLAVHAGVRMSPSDRERLEAVCKEREIPMHHAGLSSTRYEVVIPSVSATRPE